MKYLLRHTTCYNYSSSVTLSHNEARLLLRDLPWQKCANTRLIINPPPLRQHKRQDFFGNHVVYFAIQDIHDSLEVTVESEVTTQPRPKPDASMTMTWEDVAKQLAPGSYHDNPVTEADCLEARLFTLDSTFVRRQPELADFALEMLHN